MELKKCCTCKELREISFFSKNKSAKDGLKPYCKQCAKERGKKYREKNREDILKKKKEWYEKTKLNKETRTKEALEKGTRICTVCGIEKDITEYYKRGNGGFYAQCKQCQLEKQQEYHNKKRDIILVKKREYNKRRAKEIADYNKKYYNLNSESIKQRVKEWENKNPIKYKELSINQYHKRQARLKNLIHSFTKQEWEECKSYFKNEQGELECAYCGKKLKRATQDHFIPVSKGGHYIKSNIIPVCQSCNSSKCDKDFKEWYLERIFYSKEREDKVYKYINSNK